MTTVQRRRSILRACALCAVGFFVVGSGGVIFFGSNEETAALAKAPEQAGRPVTSTRLLPETLQPHVDARPESAGRSAYDFTGPESDGSTAARLSDAVSAAEWQAIEAAWRAGDFASAAQLTTRLPVLDDRRLVLLPLLTQWIAVNPTAAADFAQARPAGVERSEMLETAIRAWSDRNVAEASAWLDALAPEPDHDRAVAAIATCEVLLQRRPEIALSWAESVGTPTLRWEAICTIAQDWARRDARAAERYVETSAALTSLERARMLTHLRRWAVAVK